MRTANLRYRGVITFVSDMYGTEYMHLFSARDEDFLPQSECNEGDLVWVKKERIQELNLWEGDKLFLKMLDTEDRFFSLKLVYNKEGKLLEAVLDAKPLPL